MNIHTISQTMIHIFPALQYSSLFPFSGVWKNFDAVSAYVRGEIYEALSAILWEVGRERAPIFSRDHFLFSATID